MELLGYQAHCTVCKVLTYYLQELLNSAQEKQGFSRLKWLYIRLLVVVVGSWSHWLEYLDLLDKAEHLT